MGSRRAPADLGAAGRRLWREVLGVYELSPAEAETLRQACATIDQLAAIDEAVRDGGVVAEGSMGQLRANPLLGVAADLRRTLSVLLRDMALPMPGEVEGQRRSPAAVAAAQARWRARGAG
jgi:P27 family predicted phage terminase small subunit